MTSSGLVVVMVVVVVAVPNWEFALGCAQQKVSFCCRNLGIIGNFCGIFSGSLH